MSFSHGDIPNTATPRLQKWVLFLSSYDYDIIYSKKVEVADCLSRSPSNEKTGDAEVSAQYVANTFEQLLLRSIVDEATK